MALPRSGSKSALGTSTECEWYSFSKFSGSSGYGIRWKKCTFIAVSLPRLRGSHQRAVAGGAGALLRCAVGLDHLLAEEADRLADLFVVEEGELHVEDELVGAGLLV